MTSEDTAADETTTRRRPVDMAATILLLLGHALLAFLTFFIVAMMLMGTDNCGYVQCGDQQWANVGVLTVMLGGTALVIADLIISIARMNRGRLAWFVPLLFWVAQVGLFSAGFGLVSLAGPV